MTAKKKRGSRISGLVLFVLVLAAAVAAGEEASSLNPLGFPWEDREVFRSGLVPSEQGVLDGLPGATVYHVDLTFTPDTLALQGQQEILYTNRETQTLSEIYVRLYPNVAGGAAELTSIRRDGTPTEAKHVLDSSILRIHLDPALPPGESAILEWDLSIRVSDAYVGWGPFAAEDGVISLDQFLPVIPVYDETGWNVGPVPPQGDWSYYDASFYLVRVTAPSDLVLVAGGVEVSGIDGVQTQSRTFAAGPVRDFYLAGSSDYQAISQTHSNVRITHFVLPGGEAHAELGLRVAADALDSFEARFGPYPYTELDFATTFIHAGSAMEYPGIVAMSEETYWPGAVLWGNQPSETVMETTIVHEMAHQWFYNIVGSDQVDEPWLDEALAQYATNLYYEDTYGPARASDYRREWIGRWNAIGRRAIPVGLSTFEFESGTYGSIVYGRGPLFVVQLGEFLDLDAFFQAYIDAHRWGVASTKSFTKLAAEMSERDVTDLFTAWLYP